MNPSNLYKQQQTIGWTRIEMLIALYSAALRYLDEAITAEESQDSAQAHQKRFHVSRILVELLGGLDHQYGEIPGRLAQLCEYAHHCVISGDLTQLRSAASVLTTLKEAFEGIRDEAVQLESQGMIPRLSEIDRVHRTA